MANRYWVGGTATWDATAGSKWASTSGGAGGATVPTAADDVFLDAASGAVTVTTTQTVSICRSFTCTGFAGTLSLPNLSGALTIGDASGGAMTLSAGMTLSFSGSACQIQFAATSTNSGAGWPITTASKTMPDMLFATAGGKWTLQDSLIATGRIITLTAGTLDTNSQSVVAGSFSSSNSNTRSLILGTSSVTFTGAGTSFNASTPTGLTVSAASSTITLSGAGAFFNGFGTASFGTVNFTGSGIARLGPNTSAALTFTNITRTGTAAKTDVFSLDPPTGSTVTVTGTLTLNSNSSINRLLVQSNTVGTARTITAANVVISNIVDFMDITGAGAATWTVAGTGATALGDAGGNSGITFTSQATQTWSGTSGGNWSSNAWSGRVPLPQDNVIISSAFSASQTITADMPRLGASISFAGISGSPALSSSVANTAFGSWTFDAGVGSLSGLGALTLAARSTHTVVSAGKQFLAAVTFQGPGGTYTLQDAINCSVALTVNDGTFNTNNQSVTCATFNAQSGRTTIVNLGSSTITITSTAVIGVWQTAATLTTVNGSSSTVIISTASTNIRSFNSNQTAQTYGTITYTVAYSPGVLLMNTGASPGSTIGTLNVGSGRNLQGFIGRTVTLANWNVNGVNNGYLYLPGIAGNYITTPDSAALRIAGDLSLAIRVAMDDYTPAATANLLGKFGNTAGTTRDYRLALLTTGILRFQWSDGSITNTKDSTVTVGTASGIADGAAIWLMVTHDVDNGASSNTAKFWYAADQAGIPVSWTQIGATVTSGPVTNHSTSVTDFRAGSDSDVGLPLAGKIYRAVVWSDITQTTKQLDAELTTKPFGANTFTESSSNAATVTVAGALAQVGDGRVALTSSTAGSAATLSSSGNQTSDYLTIQDSTAQGANWYAGLHSLDNGNNKGWIFNTLTPPSTKGNFTIFGGPN